MRISKKSVKAKKIEIEKLYPYVITENKSISEIINELKIDPKDLKKANVIMGYDSGLDVKTK